MKKFSQILSLILFLLAFASSAMAQEINPITHSALNDNKPLSRINLYFFYGDGCSHCAREEKFLSALEKENQNIKIHYYEVWRNKENASLLASLGKKLGIDTGGVPMLIIGGKTIVGYYNDKTTGREIESIVADFILRGCEDVVASVLGLKNEASECVHDCNPGDAGCIHDCGCEASAAGQVPKIIHIPLVGAIETMDFSLPALTIIIAAIDGFNPCAMWVLLFLISLLLGMEDKKRMWILGSAFVAASGLVYFLFLSAWLNLFLFLGFVFWVRVVIGLTALGSGGYHLYNYYQNRGGCRVTGNEKRKLVFAKLRRIATQKKFWLALGGIILLAMAVNLIELVCSAGLPAVYTQLLALSKLSAWQYHGYLILYIFIFMLDDLLIFFIAMTTLKMKTISSRYTRWSGLIGGVIMVIIGFLLLFKPGWLMFG